MMPKQGPKGPIGPEDRDARDPSDRQVLFDEEEWGREWSGPVGWFRLHRNASAIIVIIAAAAGWWAYRTFGQKETPPLEEVAPVQPSAQTPGTSYGLEHPAGVMALSDSVVALLPGMSTTLTARAIGPEGSPLADRLVQFRIVEGSGTLRVDTVRTDSEGLAQASLVLPSVPGRVVVAADLVDLNLPGARFFVTARPRAPRSAVIVQGNGQRASPGNVLPQRIGVRVTDAEGAPVPGVEVRFHVVGEGGVVAPSRVETDASGTAMAQWRLGGTPGDQHVAALVPDISGALLTFDATAVGAAAVRSPSEIPGESTAEPVTVVSRSFAVGGSFVCALAGSRVSCRGGNDRGQRLLGSSATFSAIAAGVSHACALTADGQAFCWGANESGQLGDGSRVDRARPVAVSTNDRFSMLAAGVSFTCGLSAGGRALCWGESIGGQGDDYLTPNPVPGDHRFVQLVAGWHHACGLTAAGNAYCWGRNDHGQLGNGTRVDRGEPAEVPGTFQSLVAGSAHTCGIRGSAVLCWGDNSSGQLGDGSTQSRAFPAPVEGLPAPPTHLAAGAVSTCALLTTGRVFCWGQNVHGELGDGTRENRSTPVPVAGDLAFRSIYAGGALTCGFTNDGTQYCWGLNQSGQLGDGTRESRAVPTRVGG